MIGHAIESLYGRLLEARARRYLSGRAPSEALSRPTVSVGNLTLGGTGKTPFVEHLAARLALDGHHPAILSRGYRRRSHGTVLVSDGRGPLVGADQGGDEPVALARALPGVIVVVARRRAEAAQAAERLGADVFLLDDGYQHLSVRRDLDFLLLDARDPFGEGHFPPWGRLREPLSALARADAFVFTRAEKTAPDSTLETLHRWNPAAPVFHARIRAAGLRDDRGASPSVPVDRFVAVCGIARPETFSAALQELGLSPRAILPFSDHHRYRRRDLVRIEQTARSTGSEWIVTTEKDAVKLSDRTRLPVAAIRLSVEIAEPGFWGLLASRLRPAALAGAAPGTA